MIDWNLMPTIVLGVVLGAVALVVLYLLVSLLAAGLYRAWYFVCIEWPDSIRWWWLGRKSSGSESAS